MISEELQSRLLDGVEQLQHALNALRDAAKSHAENEHAYRLARARSFIEYAADGEKRTVDLLKAMVDLKTEKEMWKIRLAEAEHESAKEFVISLRQQVSAFQSILNAHREEAATVRYGQSAGA